MRKKPDIYTILAYVYFFFNGIGLPFGLLYMNLLTPFLYLRMLIRNKKEVLHRFLIVLGIFDGIHLMLGVEMQSFLKSNLLFVSTYIFVRAFIQFVQSKGDELPRLFRQVLVMNLVFTLIAVVIYFTPYRELMWYVNKLTANAEKVPRLAMFTYEASYYSLMFIPVAFYYLLKIFLGVNRVPARQLLLMTLLPLGLSFSIGVIGGSVITFLVMLLIHREKVLYKRPFIQAVVYTLSAVMLFTIGLAIFNPDNLLFLRLHNIFTGYDTSANGRTFESYTLGYRIAAEKSIWFGAGLGQPKVVAPPILEYYYWHWGKLDVVRIPNAIGETIAVFGLVGLAIRFLLIWYFFGRGRVLDNYYRTAMFVFMFVYQFTGSYITNIVEYVGWTLAFCSRFTVFNVKPAPAARKDDQDKD